MAVEDGRLAKNPQEQAILKRVEELRTLDETWQTVADTLTRDGERTRRGTAYSKQGIFQIAKSAGIR